MALVVVLVILAVAGFAAWRVWAMFHTPDHDIAPGASVEVTVPSGSTTQQIAEQLSAAGVISNARMFRLTTRSKDADGDLRAGAYSFTTGMSNEAVIAALLKGPEIRYTDVTIPEGFTVRQIAARFAKRAGFSEQELLTLVSSGAAQFADDHPYLKGVFRNSLEGYLFPATYRIKEGTTAEQLVEMMLDKFDSEMATVDMGFAASKNLTRTDVVIIASAIEREARLDKERRLVSSVIYNRLKAHMRLQLCATVIYEMPAGTTRLTYKDLESDSPYNTYRNDGLPPGPICNPGIESIRAAAHPASTKYLYYVLTGADGSHTFTDSYAEFQRAVKHSRELSSD